MEGLLENVRQLSRELKLQMAVIDNFIPPEYQEMIEQHVHWNDDIGEWQLKCVAYSGNNMRKQSPQPDKDKNNVCPFMLPELKNFGGAYSRRYVSLVHKFRQKQGMKYMVFNF